MEGAVRITIPQGSIYVCIYIYREREYMVYRIWYMVYSTWYILYIWAFKGFLHPYFGVNVCTMMILGHFGKMTAMTITRMVQLCPLRVPFWNDAQTTYLVWCLGPNSIMALCHLGYTNAWILWERGEVFFEERQKATTSRRCGSQM